MSNSVTTKAVLLLSIAALLIVATASWAQVNPETRAMWLNRWEATNDTQIQACVNYMVAHKFNTLLVQVYGDGYALYNSTFVPHSPLVASGFDSLASAVTKGHAAGLEVHAYINMINIYSGGLGQPSNPNHLINAHPEWAMQDSTGWSMINYVGQSGTMIFYCPEQPGFRQYCHDVAVEIATNYAVDGIHMDYIRYPDSGTYCYCPTHRTDFYNAYGRYPSAGDPQWDQWRYDNITSLVRWIYEDVHAAKPLCKVSAAVWKTNGANFQDAYAWLREGILDAAAPMTYTSDMALFNQWVTAYNQNSGGRQILAGIYAPASLFDDQVIAARTIGVEGQALESYADINNRTTRDIDKVYTQSAAVFPMPWLDGSPDLWPPVLSGIGATGISGNSAIIVWHSDERADSKVEYGLTTSYGSSRTDAALIFDHEIELTGLSTSTTYHYRVTSKDAAHNSTTSGDYTFTTTSGGIADIIIDDGDSGYTKSGEWYYSSGAGSAAYNGDYDWASDDVVESCWAKWTPYISVAGNYEVSIMYRSGTNRCTNSPYTVYYNGGSETFPINQQLNGGVWNVLGAFNFAVGSSGYVKLGNVASGGDVVIADAVKWHQAGGGPTPTPTPTPGPTPTPSGKVYVNDITMGSGSNGKNYYATATVWIKNDSGADVSGATVYGDWSGCVSGSSSGATGGNGKVTLQSANKKGGGTFIFTVTDVQASGYVYDPSMNVETSDSISAP
jgi:uncharacterized lipoprotein YddW (UPF0748 family)